MRFPHGCNDQPQFVLGLPTRLEGADDGGVTTGAGGRRTAEEHPPQSQATARPLTPRLRLQLHAFPRHPDLPENSSFTVSDFVAMQQSHIAGQSRLLQGKNMEIENAVTDLIQHIMTYQFETQNETVPEKDATKLRRVVPPPAESRVARHGEGVDPDPVGILIILASVPLGRFGFYGRRRRPRRRRCRSSLFRMFSSPSSLVRGRR